MTTLFTAKAPKTIFGYDVVSRLGEGAGSVIYAVCDQQSGQLYALKHIVRKVEKDLRYIEQVQNEFEVSKFFRHPTLRKCIDLKITKKLLSKPSEAALVMELVDGTPLEQQSIRSIPRLLEIFQHAGQGLVALHHLRYLHCDFKPSNILTCSDGQVKLIDFGQACKSGTIKERVQGTPDFIAPEQVRCKTLDPTTDVFCFGASLYWALTARRIPTLFTTGKDEWRDLKEQRYPTPRDLNPEVPEPLSRLVMWCCKVSRGSRPADMGMVLAGMEKVTELMRGAPP